jgi:hypothetical protein
VSGQERLTVADHLELHELVEARFPGQSRVAHRLIGGIAAGSVGQQEVLIRTEMMEDPVGFGAIQIHPPNRHSDDFSARSLDRPRHLAVIAILPGSHHEPGTETPPANSERQVGYRFGCLKGAGHAGPRSKCLSE